LARTGASRKSLPSPCLRGSARATIDAAGRLKLPAPLRRAIEEGFGRELYLTSLEGDRVWVFPLPVWQERERRVLALGSLPRAVSKFLERTSYYGAESAIDAQGRVLVPPLLRSEAAMDGEVAVLGALDHLVVFNGARLRARLAAEPLLDDDRRVLGELGLA
jgi:MraZ protein